MIGLSVSFCIRDMVEGRVDPAQVEKIVAGTNVVTAEQIEEVVKAYRENYWDSNPDEAEKLYRRFLAEGKIEQPRQTKDRAPMLANRRHWVESEDQIVWSDRFCEVSTPEDRELI